MPGPLDFFKSITTKYQTPPVTPEEQAAMDARASSAQQDEAK